MRSRVLGETAVIVDPCLSGQRIRRRAGRVLMAAAAVVVLAGCRVDVTTSVQLDDAGAGAVTVDVVADPEVVQRVPDLAEQVRLDDLTASGWQTDGVVPTDDGGLRVTLVHPVTGPDEANQVLAELNGAQGPYRSLVVERTADDAAVMTRLTGSLAVDDIGALADDVQPLLPDVPLSSLLIQPDGSQPAITDVFGARLVVGLPDADGDTTSVTFDDEGVTDAQVFDLSANGPVDVTVQSVTEIDPGMRAPIIALIAVVALVAWLAVSIAFTRYVLRQRRRPT